MNNILNSLNVVAKRLLTLGHIIFPVSPGCQANIYCLGLSGLKHHQLLPHESQTTVLWIVILLVDIDILYCFYLTPRVIEALIEPVERSYITKLGQQYDMIKLIILNVNQPFFVLRR